tara:strand:+ start:685 stop:1665 length:981 start_codon:yes stop_codon:yes gene_type:complete
VNDTANTIDAAVEQLIQVPDTSTEDATEEVVEETSEEEVVEPTEQDAESEETLEFDDEELSELDFDSDDVEEVLEESTEKDSLHTVKINGKEENWTLDQLKQSAAGQGYINQRMQEVAKLEKAYKEQTAALAQQQQQQLEFYQKAQETGFSEPTPPSKELFNNDPIAYMEAKLSYDEAKAEHDTKVQQFQQMQKQQEQQQQQQLQAFTQQQTQLLAEKLPDIADPQKGEVIKKGLMEVGEHYGFSQQELESVRDHRYILAMYDAMRFRKLLQKRGKATSKKQSIAPVKAGAKKTPNVGKAKARKQKQDRLRKTGSIDDAVDLILNS